MGEKKRHKKKKKWRAKKFLTTQTVSLCGRRNRTKRERKKWREIWKFTCSPRLLPCPPLLCSGRFLFCLIIPVQSADGLRHAATRSTSARSCVFVSQRAGECEKEKGQRGYCSLGAIWIFREGGCEGEKEDDDDGGREEPKESSHTSHMLSGRVKASSSLSITRLGG